MLLADHGAHVPSLGVCDVEAYQYDDVEQNVPDMEYTVVQMVDTLVYSWGP